MKSQMRLLVLERKQDNEDPNIWGPLAGLEAGFVEEAQKVWASLLTSWGWTDPPVQPPLAIELTAIVEDAHLKAREEVSAQFRDKFSEEDLGVIDTFEPQLLSVP